MKTRVYKAPQKINRNSNRLSIFLAGSIEMGVAENWQQKVERELQEYDIDIYNPRRDDWDASWVQSIDNPQFYEQVTWELTSLEQADLIIMYFDPKTMSPISLLEFGLYAPRDNKLLVVCPDGFWRKGNVDIVCKLYNVEQYDTIDEALLVIKNEING